MGRLTHGSLDFARRRQFFSLAAACKTLRTGPKSSEARLNICGYVAWVASRYDSLTLQRPRLTWMVIDYIERIYKSIRRHSTVGYVSRIAVEQHAQARQPVA